MWGNFYTLLSAVFKLSIPSLIHLRGPCEPRAANFCHFCGKHPNTLRREPPINRPHRGEHWKAQLLADHYLSSTLEGFLRHWQGGRWGTRNKEVPRWRSEVKPSYRKPPPVALSGSWAIGTIVPHRVNPADRLRLNSVFGNSNECSVSLYNIGIGTTIAQTHLEYLVWKL